MRLWKPNKRSLTYSIIATLLLIGCITSACLLHLTRIKRNNEIYSNAQPALHIADPRDAHIWSIVGTSQLPADTLYPLSDIPLPDLHPAHRSSLNNSHCLVALYPDSTWAVWHTLHPEKTQMVIEHFSRHISNNYTPIKETHENGTIYHFTTRDNQFLHLYILPGIIGFSYHEALLTQPSRDTRLQQIIEETNTVAHNRLYFFHNNRWQHSRCIHNTAVADSTNIQ